MKNKDKVIVGWQEWVSLPQLGIERIKAKVDTGAKTSCLHTFAIEEFRKNEQLWIRFWVHPVQSNDELVVQCESQVLDQRLVRDSGGHQTQRYVINTELVAGNLSFPIEMTLTPRDNMKFRMLLGRTSLKAKMVVDPAKSFLLAKE
ncbi:ATP-dependent zinc protease [Photobacterium sp. DNB23_23_1]|uniref:ATP-dependent zinc protease n=1 Tax=Photobacterium pectinilyticum TaxID=2906793 RepID=A0ABT1MZQ0_9GAMM|nr:ATP-dependent zinc protease [Photobacterium sp. ZSDE20]MCQ1056514.1 ATP-dependent zinc protease [Photobacterium sp. ZSDE20]MDD1820649.1 ATP-dependent zinc protease [Photobacterium sp. ZSDE20]